MNVLNSLPDLRHARRLVIKVGSALLVEGKKARDEEIAMANRELVILRKARMQALYEQDLKS